MRIDEACKQVAHNAGGKVQHLVRAAARAEAWVRQQPLEHTQYGQLQPPRYASMLATYKPVV